MLPFTFPLLSGRPLLPGQAGPAWGGQTLLRRSKKERPFGPRGYTAMVGGVQGVSVSVCLFKVALRTVGTSVRFNCIPAPEVSGRSEPWSFEPIRL